MARRYVALALLAFLFMVSTTGVVSQANTRGEASNQVDPVEQAKDVAVQVWKVVGPYVQQGFQWAKSAGSDVFFVVYERASFQGVKAVASEASRIAYHFFTGRPYQAAYQVAKNVPIVGSAVKDVIGEANLRKQAAREHVEEQSEL